MKLTIERARRLKSLAQVHSVVERRNTSPSLAMVKLVGRPGSLSL